MVVCGLLEDKHIRLYPLSHPLHSTATVYPHDLLFICKLLSIDVDAVSYY
jgi:hypothetical protein